MLIALSPPHKISLLKSEGKSTQQQQRAKATHTKVFMSWSKGRNFACFMLLFTCFTISVYRKICFSLSHLFSAYLRCILISNFSTKTRFMLLLCETAASELLKCFLSTLAQRWNKQLSFPCIAVDDEAHIQLRSSERRRKFYYTRISSQYGGEKEKEESHLRHFEKSRSCEDKRKGPERAIVNMDCFAWNVNKSNCK